MLLAVERLAISVSENNAALDYAVPALGNFAWECPARRTNLKRHLLNFVGQM
jgi:hypothetical protein